ncbi:hypothetical protein LCAZH_0023 [Lacticaseibacillus paracasei]|nr:hypothetical protein LCAZH_0023 [Lacticaseibacillus paracasei]EPC23306.1 hypothetical protein Lpp17_2279 [Lacticaseibacillus paracasei subsp. paracasei Lpp17]EPC28309.1 hypothetical protein Lpp46_0500 [Lacticaseibacillus paracasei subsp. paracasei Lpp46]AGP66781.1 Hypothetical protein LOCK919_0024 [Lacticaseibacillus paracasei]OUC69713.1 hypothetical protein B4Q23_2856c [Lacticaseibacillus paracasei]
MFDRIPCDFFFALRKVYQQLVCLFGTSASNHTQHHSIAIVEIKTIRPIKSGLLTIYLF